MASSPPHFFKVILPSSLEHKKLRIPQKFVRDFAHELSDDATLAVPNGRPWQVRLKRDEGSVWFDLKREEEPKLDKRSRQSAANYSFENFKAKRKYCGCEPQIKKCRKEEFVEKNELGVNDIEYNLWGLLREMGICISKKNTAFSTEESKRALKIARSLDLKYPTSLIILQSSSIKHNRVYVPATFAKHFVSRDAKSVEVRVSNETQKNMNMHVCWRENGGFALTMTELVKDENLKGDILIFELISKKDALLNLSIYHL